MATSNQDKRLTIFEFFTNLCAAVFFSIILSICIEWVLMTFIRPELGSNPSRQMALTEISYIHETTVDYIFHGYSPKELSDWSLGFIYGKPFDPDKVSDWFWVQTFSDDATMTAILKAVISIATEYGLSAIYIITTVLARTTILIFSIPLFLIALLAGLCDGLVERELRKFGGGTESALSYHYAKAWVVRSYYITWFVYLTLPFSLNPVFMLLPGAGIVFGMSFMAAWSFKKYF